MTIKKWHDDAVELLKAQWDSGRSAAEIVTALAELGYNFSRCAVLGRVHRLKLPKRAVKVSTKKMPLPAAVINLHEAARPTTGKTMAELKPNDCRWPFGDPKQPGFVFCGQLATQPPYCAAHSARAYTRSTPIRSHSYDRFE